MTVDQIDNNRPELPNSHSELTQYLHAMADTIQASFNDYAFNVGDYYFNKKIKAPTLEELIEQFGLLGGINWRLQDPKNFTGFDTDGKRLIRGSFPSGVPSLLLSLMPEGAETTHILSHNWASETRGHFYHSQYHYGEEMPPGNKDYQLVSHYHGKMVKDSNFLVSMNEREGTRVEYHTPFFKRGQEDLTREEVIRAYKLREQLEHVNVVSPDPTIVARIQQEEQTNKVFTDLKEALHLDYLRSAWWFKGSGVLDILRLNEMGQLLVRGFREEGGAIDYDEQNRIINAFTVNLWLLWGKPVTPVVIKSEYREPINPYPKPSNPFGIGFNRFGIIDSYGGSSDPRGYIGPDPRGPDPRGPR